MAELSKYFLQSEVVELLRSQIHFADYNPRKIDAEGKKALKRSIKTHGVIGGIIVNKQTDYTVVGGHQKIELLDELNKYNPDTQENDYMLRAEVIDVDLKTEKTINILLNNPNVGGKFDFDKLKGLIPDIDWKDAGLTEADLSMIGVDAIFKTEDEENLAEELNNMMSEVDALHQEEVAQRKEERKQAKQAMKAEGVIPQEPMTEEDKVAHMKEVKQQAKEAVAERAANMDAYFMLSFDTWEAKAAFCEKYGLDPTQKFIKGEDFENRLDGFVDDDF